MDYLWLAPQSLCWQIRSTFYLLMLLPMLKNPLCWNANAVCPSLRSLWRMARATMVSSNTMRIISSTQPLIWPLRVPISKTYLRSIHKNICSFALALSTRRRLRWRSMPKNAAMILFITPQSMMVRIRRSILPRMMPLNTTKSMVPELSLLKRRP